MDVGGKALLLANMSVWESADRLFDYVYRSAHRDVMVKRRAGFEKSLQLYQVLWWIPAGHIPSAEEGLQKLKLLWGNGPSAEVFTFKLIAETLAA
ncbi:DUF3291 domain-containing protein [Halieaceae bacterium IMCC14734]|uniref:DUF3291 domain-containing protein n=1 Tax=Candidatus Litorirhabdus singularis TaxID=2518993 RepID=A0ABT3TI50_9GAMM|nr:DUF3291 domain-containing protein [Candidatus Litorirhabdus singularis]